MPDKNGVEEEREDGMKTSEDSGMQSDERKGVRLKKPTHLPNSVSLPIASTDPSLHMPMLNQLSAMRRPQSTSKVRPKDCGTTDVVKCATGSVYR